MSIIASVYMEQTDIRVDMNCISNRDEVAMSPIESTETKKNGVLSWLRKNYLAVILAFALGGILIGFGIFVLFRGV